MLIFFYFRGSIKEWCYHDNDMLTEMLAVAISPKNQLDCYFIHKTQERKRGILGMCSQVHMGCFEY